MASQLDVCQVKVERVQVLGPEALEPEQVPEQVTQVPEQAAQVLEQAAQVLEPEQVPEQAALASEPERWLGALVLVLEPGQALVEPEGRVESAGLPQEDWIWVMNQLDLEMERLDSVIPGNLHHFRWGAKEVLA